MGLQSDDTGSPSDDRVLLFYRPFIKVETLQTERQELLDNKIFYFSLVIFFFVLNGKIRLKTLNKDLVLQVVQVIDVKSLMTLSV